MDPAPDEVLGDPRVAAAVESIRASAAVTLDEQIALTRIPAPPFGEAARGRAVLERFRALGLAEPRVDAVGNVLAVRPGEDGGAPIVLSAHLDTVFPEETPIVVRRDGNTVRAPGIADDGRGLAVMLAIGRALQGSGLTTFRPVLFCATVGEEGVGNLRGVRHLVGPDGSGREAAGFISIDGAGVERIVTEGIGSLRLCLKLRGPGGHSWQDWGTPNPMHALAAAVAELSQLSLPTEPRATLSVGRWGGGTSVNAIPQEAWAEIDIRSPDPGAPSGIAEELRRIVSRCVDRESARGPGALTEEVEILGERPAGATPPDHPLVEAAVRATLSVGVTPLLVASSTDANAAMAAGIPAITMGGGGNAGLAHTTDEWYDDRGGPDGVVRAFLTVLEVAGLHP